MFFVKYFHRGRRFLKFLSSYSVDFIFPPLCFICHDFLMRGEGYLCASCFRKLDFIVEPYCIQCALPFPYPELFNSSCAKCSRYPPSWRTVRAVFLYNEASKALIFPFKYHGNVRNILLFGDLLYKNGSDLLEKADFIIPVPLHIRKMRQRGYNQATLLARYLSRKSGTKLLLDALKRVYFTRPLASLTMPERKRELEKAMIISPHRISLLKNKKIILVDDILTTGITAETCTKILLNAGCKSVDVFVIARTDLGDE